jgi:hypothetical protein
MTRTRRTTRRAAVYTLALAVAGAGGAVARADTSTADTTALQAIRTAIQASRPPVRGNYPGTYASIPTGRPAFDAAADVLRGSRPPIRGNYPGTYPSPSSIGSSSKGFAWGDAGIGGAATLGAILLIAAVRATRLAARRRHIVSARGSDPV